MTLLLTAEEMDTRAKDLGDLVWQTDITKDRPNGLYCWNGMSWSQVVLVAPLPPLFPPSRIGKPKVEAE